MLPRSRPVSHLITSREAQRRILFRAFANTGQRHRNHADDHREMRQSSTPGEVGVNPAGNGSFGGTLSLEHLRARER